LLTPTDTPLFLKQEARRRARPEERSDPKSLSQGPKRLLSIAPPRR
jgi:hypothetical protein